MLLDSFIILKNTTMLDRWDYCFRTSYNQRINYCTLSFNFFPYNQAGKSVYKKGMHMVIKFDLSRAPIQDTMCVPCRCYAMPYSPNTTTTAAYIKTFFY